ncbi:unannotated protein [freshwater metagenome]|uniref:Unannotated protein n=1 Tax=freshwater metagenome TaxID=449393 RepID=A0A6J7QZT9_9ZZZZ
MRSCALQQRHRPKRRQPEQASSGLFAVGEVSDIGRLCGSQHLVFRDERLHQHSAPAGARAHQAAGADQQGKCLFCRPVTRREHLCVEVEERHHVDTTDTMQYRLGADVHVTRWQFFGRSRDRDDGTVGCRRQLFLQPRHTRFHQCHRARTALLTHHGTSGAAATTCQQPVVALRHGSVAAGAALQRPTGSTSKQPRPAGGVDHADDLLAAVAQMGNQLRCQQRPLPRLFLGAIDDLQRRPPVHQFGLRGTHHAITGPPQRGHCGARRHEHTGSACTLCALDGDVARMPRGSAFFLQ